MHFSFSCARLERKDGSARHAARRGRNRLRPASGALERFEDRALMATLSLGVAQDFAVLAGSAVTNTGASALVGDLGVSPGTAVTGLPPGLLTGGTIHAADAVALQAQTDLTTAYNVLAGEPAQADLTGRDLGGMTLLPGVYHFSSSAQLTGTLTLDAQGDPNARFDFQIGSTLTTASHAKILLTNGADACNVYWQVGSSATLGTGTTFQGNILALTSITLNTGADIVSGRALARNGAVSLDSDSVSNVCVMPVTPPVVTPPVVTPPVVTPPVVTPPVVTPPVVTPPVVTPPVVKPPVVTPPVVTPPPVTTTTTVTKLPGGITTTTVSKSPTGIKTIIVTQTATGTRTTIITQTATGTRTTTVITPPPDAITPPTVTGLRRYGFHAQPTILVLSFSGALDPTRAQDLANYALVGPVGGLGRGGHPIAIGAAIYDPSAHTVTLLPVLGMNVHYHYKLTIHGTGPLGVAGSTGTPLDGASTGRPGSDYTTIFGRDSLVGPASAYQVPSPALAPAVVSARVSGPLHRWGHLTIH